MRKLNKRLTNKQDYKKTAKECKVCKQTDYDLLDVHRIIEGKDGGEYTDLNVVILCSNCHRKAHAGTIKIDKWYQSSAGKVLHYWDENGEHFE